MSDTNSNDATPSDIAPADKDLPQIVSDGIRNWQERTDVEPDVPATDSELEQMERDLQQQSPNPENYPENNDGEALPDKESPSEDGNEGDDRSDSDGESGDRDGGDQGGDREGGDEGGDRDGGDEGGDRGG
ncbi:hypothetical protein [Bradyrhizobium sp.]|uniref:hypothetical protein n=1 Tax=Bradyrhizobium sp. TaxID=376 RepID=UPI001ED5AB17|nr:hypothetical protein [Bradyrhizobium sp.]MBV9983090.1 hypothetical protein [Bradyrhizobium sp.]